MSSDRSIAEKLARTIRAHREGAGLSQEELAHRAGLHRTFVSQIERGLKSPSLNSLVAIATALRMKVRDLLRGVED